MLMSTARLPILIFLFLLGVAFHAEGQPISNIEEFERPINTIVRPPTEVLFSTILESSTLISRKSKLRLADLIRKMDEGHLTQLRAAMIHTRKANDIHLWIRERTVDLPRMTPLCERTVSSAFSLQVEMLDAILWEKNKKKSEELRISRTKIKILDESNRFYHDDRDSFICMILELLNQISNLQEALGACKKTSFAFPTQSQTSLEIEEYVLAKIEFVTEESSRLGNDCERLR